ncbi:hypothetical protein JCM8547_002989 [Rhodosporidiobolus lusitaniae]
MRSLLSPLLFLPSSLASSFSSSASSQHPLPATFPAPYSSSTAPLTDSAPRPLTGRFIHLTDLHPDPFYKSGADEDEACHFPRKKKKHKKKSGVKEDGKSAEEDEVELVGEEEEREDGRYGLQKRAKDNSRTAGYWGLPVSDCDSPLTLLNATFDWLEENFKGEVDFVVWTGDNARHDIDTRLPRSMPEIFELNRYILERMRRTFGKDTAIISSIGNNDIYPHNVMFPGPSKITNTFLNLWSPLIPEHFAHTFARGGYYSAPAGSALKDDLLLVSLNTLYFYDRNTVVDGCPPVQDDLASFTSLAKPWTAALLDSSSSSPLADDDPYLPHPSSSTASVQFSAFLSTLAQDLDPGTEQLLWLEQQLVLARARGMQVYLTGHVPATRGNWYEGCWKRFGELLDELGGTVLGQLYGHMNVDHVTFMTPKDMPHLPHDVSLSSSPSDSLFTRLLSRLSSSSPSTPSTNEEEPAPSPLNVADYLFSLYSSLPSHPERQNLDKYAAVHVNPSVIPTYVPGVRVWEYNTTRPSSVGEEGEEEDEGGWRTMWTKKKKGKRGGKKKKGKKGKKGPSKDDEKFGDAPSRRNTFLTPLGFTQYFLPESAFERANQLAEEHFALSPNSSDPRPPPAWEIEYTTLSSSSVVSRLLSRSSSSRQNFSIDALLLPSTLPPPVQSLLSLPPSAGKTHRLRRLLKQLSLTPFDPYYAGASGETGAGREALTLGTWIRAARGMVEGGREGRRWKEARGRMGVGTGEV